VPESGLTRISGSRDGSGTAHRAPRSVVTRLHAAAVWFRATRTYLGDGVLKWYNEYRAVFLPRQVFSHASVRPSRALLWAVCSDACRLLWARPWLLQMPLNCSRERRSWMLVAATAQPVMDTGVEFQVVQSVNGFASSRCMTAPFIWSCCHFHVQYLSRARTRALPQIMFYSWGISRLVH
jgi:hypothetical protein